MTSWLTKIDALRLAVVLGQLALVCYVFWTYQLESRAFNKLLILAAAGFVLNHLLPQRLRLPWFACISVAGVVWVLGPERAAWILGIGGALIALCHTPVPFGWRVAMLAAAGLALVALRAEWGGWRLEGVVWPVLGSMFAFRMILYLYELRVGRPPSGFWHAVAYFFMLPNVCFPLFPVVDYRGFFRTHYRGDAVAIYQRGVHWIVRGAFHLVTYRLVNRHLVMGSDDVRSAGDVIQALTANFLLYLRISGDFHVIAGMLHLFGFNLADTHRLYVLASSFSDFWRRINIYWKDFMQRVFFYPAHFRIRRAWNETAATVLATLLVFLATWLLHSYQWFWIRGDFPITWQDIVFWSVLGACLVGNGLYEFRRAGSARSDQVSRSWRREASLALRTVLMFFFTITLWSLWTTRSWQEWRDVMSHVLVFEGRDLAITASFTAALALGAVFLGRRRGRGTELSVEGFWRNAAASALAATFLALLGVAAPRVAGGDARLAWLRDLTSSQPTVAEAKRQDRGYYEGLTNVRRFDEALASIYSQPLGWNSALRSRRTGTLPAWENVPNFSHSFSGKIWTSNRWGMRDRDYERAKPPNTVRVGLFGDSQSAGHGVADGENYESLIEAMWNGSGGGSGERVEILNFSVGGYGPYGRLLTAQRRASEFQLDLIVYVAMNELDWMVTEVAAIYAEGVPLLDPELAAIAATADVTVGTPEEVGKQRLPAVAEEMLRWIYAELRRYGDEAGVGVVVLLLPRADDRIPWREELPRTRTRAAEAGLEVVDITDAYEPVQERESLWVSPLDIHPNAAGHRLLADRLAPLLDRAITSRRHAAPVSLRSGVP